ncbi:MAG: ribonuclease P protein component [Bacteroidota bacterium]
MTKYTFQRDERLKSKKNIDYLFSGKGKSFGAYTLRIIWAEVDNTATSSCPVQCAVSVPKKKFSKAVQRNRIKRQLREAWRLHKHHLYAKLPVQKQYAIMLLYTGKQEATQTEIERQVQYIIRKFLRKLNTLAVPKATNKKAI